MREPVEDFSGVADHKNQHFVPRSYFRPFSVDGNGAAINLYNSDRRRAIGRAPLRGQCSGDYFYGEDLRLEKLLQGIEGQYASVVRELSAPGCPVSDVHRMVLRYFCFLQNTRTEAASKRVAIMANDLANFAFEENAPEDFRLSFREAVQIAMHTFAENMSVVNDLKVCIIRNTTKLSFITSDDPSVLANRWYQHDSRARGKAPGVQSAGVLFLLPLSPELLCLVYDGDVYSVANKGGWVVASNIEDVRALNEHQFLNFAANIYFRDWQTIPEIERQLGSAGSRRLSSRHRLNLAVLESEDSWGQHFKVVSREQAALADSALIHYQRLYPALSRWPSFLKWRTGQRIYSNGSGTGFVRPSVVEGFIEPGQPYRRIKAR